MYNDAYSHDRIMALAHLSSCDAKQNIRSQRDLTNANSERRAPRHLIARAALGGKYIRRMCTFATVRKEPKGIMRFGRDSDKRTSALSADCG